MKIHIFDTEPHAVALVRTEPMTLEQMQATVGGYLEAVPCDGTQWDVCYVNDEGRIRDLPKNVRASNILGYNVYGTVMFIQGQESEYYKEEIGEGVLCEV